MNNIPNAIYKSCLQILKRFPVLYAGMQGAYNYRVVTRAAVETPLGFKMAGSYAMEKGDFEPEETKLICNLLRDVDVFVNAGANVGYYCCLARKMGLEVIAFEPLERNIQMLQRNISANNWTDVEIHPIGLGDSVALQKLYGGGTGASLLEGWAGADNKNYRIVPVNKLDNILGQRLCGRKSFILIDVEGYELNLLRGATQQLTSCPSPTWLVEICINQHQPNGNTINPNLISTFEIFWGHGYKANKIGSEFGIVSESDVRMWAKGYNLPDTHNFLFTK
jgi:FkbM family methyltransferase